MSSQAVPGPRSPASDVRVVLVTAPAEGAETLGRTIVGERLAACVNLVPGVRSIYRWNGKVQRSEERLLIIKTAALSAVRVEQRVHELHSYETPEVIALPIVGGSEAYLEWLRSSST